MGLLLGLAISRLRELIKFYAVLVVSKNNGFAKLFTSDCDVLAKSGLSRHFGGIIGPEVKRILASSCDD
jgi:hypothetical protein